FDQDLGDIGGIPRLLDVGQCNDAYSAVQIALALANAFECEVNDLPLSMVLSWYEQKACAILLSLLYLGIKDIRLGPSLPAFISPNILNVLVEKFNIMPIKTPDEDLKAILG
ncbi:MAG: hydroxylamine reductase, partial [Desulfobacteraceae bacterium]|nr:hydroxylamine reductase [Desulfobacteraceae bacterium]